ncbi:hypothetical protein [Paractinoplanes rishiriensis]|uniref:PPE family domain-containing protein n=1 Tax=Paractinoplanes rishiriensis TaxID=1050105 RepID=A0A919MS56_9ACTN|nr:hypothetical protein [Actinoplanes rishiriensis]GIE93293.1 hypothetical protein Ari01nite_07580 [Actinoplanes rishiriensis]
MATDWHRYNLPAIWQMVQPENVCTAADRVLAWEALATAVREQHRRLLRAGEALADVWPPEHNKSALKFLNRIDDLAASMLETLTCAEDTRTGLRGVTETLAEAQSTIRDLATGRAAVSTDWVPRFIDHAEDDYDKQAQQTMQAAEATIAEHTQNLKTPPLYAPRVNQSDGKTIFDNGEGELGSVTPLPVVVPNDPVLREPGDGPAREGATPPAPDPSLGVGPGLSGVTAPPAPPPGAVSGPGAGPGVLPGLSTGPGVGSGVLPSAPTGVIPGFGGFAAPPVRPGASAVRPGAPPDPRAISARRPLPPGAVIGEGLLGGARGGSAAPVPLGMAGTRRAGNAAAATGGVADEQWEALAGVVPVIVPNSRSVRHDPGPGVIGIDR